MMSMAARVLSSEVIVYLINLAVVASVICIFGLLATRICKNHIAPVKHGILLTVLVLQLLSPALLWMAQQTGVAYFPVALDQPRNDFDTLAPKASMRPPRGSLRRANEARSGTAPKHQTVREHSTVFEEASGMSAVLDWGPPLYWVLVLGTVLAAIWGGGAIIYFLVYARSVRMLMRLHVSLERSSSRLRSHPTNGAISCTARRSTGSRSKRSLFSHELDS